jgi:hypothetical protein
MSIDHPNLNINLSRIAFCFLGSDKNANCYCMTILRIFSRFSDVISAWSISRAGKSTDEKAKRDINHSERIKIWTVMYVSRHKDVRKTARPRYRCAMYSCNSTLGAQDKPKMDVLHLALSHFAFSHRIKPRVGNFFHPPTVTAIPTAVPLASIKKEHFAP